MARNRAPQQIIEAIQREIQLTPREFAQALRVSEVWFCTLVTSDQLRSVARLTMLFTRYLQQTPEHPPPSPRTRLTRTSRGLFSQLCAQASRTDSPSFTLVVQ